MGIDRLADARVRLQQALRDGESTEPHRQAIAMLEQAERAAETPIEQPDLEREARIEKRARQITKASLKEIDNQIASIQIPTAPEMP